ncbi:helix-turn-helix domain-containing protein [Sutcliffiella horikoshii]|uniref:Helix-turn-helix transcriptional regulator n=1 Tax=Sutcliffiella horikoshii TaxID=79883 RepID=A0A5D4TBZ3_9BACI|nr:helix-turn-helix transcriptional regulator [Sutcliffiella horikoshii]TYS72411.1 helix-turn-helix transcriptional regulator [Sutcliffiella horikoshii]
MSMFLQLVGSRIRDIRKGRGYTQEELADKIGIQNSYIGGIERGERNISLLTLEKIANGLDVAEREFFNFSKVDVSNNIFEKQQAINILISSLQNMSLEEILLINKIFSDVTKLMNPNKK